MKRFVKLSAAIYFSNQFVDPGKWNAWIGNDIPLIWCATLTSFCGQSGWRHSADVTSLETGLSVVVRERSVSLYLAEEASTAHARWLFVFIEVAFQRERLVTPSTNEWFLIRVRLYMRSQVRLVGETFSHTGDIWMVFHQCACERVLAVATADWIACHSAGTHSLGCACARACCRPVSICRPCRSGGTCATSARCCRAIDASGGDGRGCWTCCTASRTPGRREDRWTS